jgi:hypothetical protein
MKITKLIFAFIIGLFITASVIAQSNENQLFFASKVIIKPEKVEQYIELSKVWVSACKEYNYPYSFSVWRSNIYDFYWFYPADDYNEVTEMTSKAWSEIIPNMEEGFPAEYFENIEYSESFFIRWVDSLSYNPQTSIEGLGYAEWWVHYMKPWTGLAYRKAFKNATDIRKKANFEYPTAVLQSDIGMNGGSAYISVFWGTDVADLYTHQNKAWELLDDEAQQMILDLVPLRRKYEKIGFWYQKDLSYSPE